VENTLIADVVAVNMVGVEAVMHHGTKLLQEA